MLRYDGDVSVEEYISTIIEGSTPAKALKYIALDMEGESLISNTDQFSTDEYLKTVVRAAL